MADGDSQDAAAPDYAPDRHFLPVLWRWARPLLLIGLVALIIEIIAAPLLPRLLPESAYLRVYLPWESLHQTERFLAGENSIELDPRLGWRNRPESSYQNIHYDAHGSRSHQGITAGQRKPERVIFLGDSRVYGHTYVEDAETINAWLDSDTVETLNFAAPRHNLDQSYLAMQSFLDEFQPTSVVIGLGTDVGEELACLYMPFFSVEEVSMPLLKPRFMLQDGDLEAKTPPYQDFLSGVAERKPDAMLAYLRDNDACYAHFEFYQRWAATPFLSILQSSWQRLDRFTYNKAEKLGFKRPRPLPNKDLVRALLQASRDLAAQRGVKLAFILFPTEFQFQGYQQDAYAEVADLLKETGVKFVDGLSLLQRHADEFPVFLDEVHFSPQAGRVIAAELQSLLRLEPEAQ